MEKQTLDQFSSPAFIVSTLFQGAFFGILVTHVIGVIRLILEIIYPVPQCGETDNRPVFLSGIHSFYFSQIMMAIQVVLVLGISLFTGPRSKKEVMLSTYIKNS